MLLRTRTDQQRRSGSAAVEFAVVAPILVTLMAGIWEVGRMVEVSQQISNAAREGARQSSGGNKTAADVDTIVKNHMIASGLNTTGYTVTVRNLTLNPNPQPSDPSDNPSAANQMDHLRVTVTLPFNNVKWIMLNQITSVTTLNASADWFSMKDQPLVVDSTMPNN